MFGIALLEHGFGAFIGSAAAGLFEQVRREVESRDPGAFARRRNGGVACPAGYIEDSSPAIDIEAIYELGGSFRGGTRDLPEISGGPSPSDRVFEVLDSSIHKLASILTRRYIRTACRNYLPEPA